MKWIIIILKYYFSFREKAHLFFFLFFFWDSSKACESVLQRRLTAQGLMLTAFIGNNSKFRVLLFPFSEITTLTATNWASMSAAVSSVLLKSADTAYGRAFRQQSRNYNLWKWLPQGKIQINKNLVIWKYRLFLLTQPGRESMTWLND